MTNIDENISEDTYKYDVAFSLCKEDASFAYKLVDGLNPNLNVFFYETKQEELISKHGPEKFRKVFKEEARLVVILYRENWGKSIYTGLEQDSIIERLTIEGSEFIMMIPVDKKKTPDWYPSSRIYVNPFNFSSDEIAKFIEFKVAELGAEVKPVTFEDSFNHLKEKLESKSEHIKLLQSKDTLEIAKKEISNITQSFNTKIEFVKDNNHYFSYSPQSIVDYGESRSGSFSMIDINIRLELIIEELNIPIKNRNSQSFDLAFGIIRVNEDRKNTVILNQKYKFLTQDRKINGWSEKHVYQLGDIKNNHDRYLYRAGREIYDLKNFYSSEYLVDTWFKKLFEITKKEYDFLIKH